MSQVDQAESHYQQGCAFNKDKRFVEAVTEWRAAAALGHGTAMADLAIAYETGQGVAKNVAEAQEWYKRAAAAGSVKGMFNLALNLRKGVPEAGIAPDRAEAMRLVRKAAGSGDVDAMFGLGKWLAEDNKDDPEQVVWFRRAVEKGNAAAMNHLAVCYSVGSGGLARNSATAVAWLRKAAELGHPVSMYNLGAMYEGGNGVEKNLVTAAEWYARASKAGHAKAPAALERVKAASQAAPAAASLEQLPSSKIFRSADLSPPIGEARKLGAGAFGAVYAMTLHGGINVAVKVLHVGSDDKKAVALFTHEAALHATLSCEHIAPLMGVVLDGPHLQIVMPLMQCSLWDAIHKAECAHYALVREWAARVQICIEIATGLLYLHALTPSIVHRDLKSPNVLLDRRGTVKLVDFGLAQTKQHASTNTSTKGAVGTVQWMAPEILDADGARYSAAVDIYALGVTAWELAALKQPYEHAHSPMQIMFKVAQGGRPEIPADTPAPFRSAIEACWAQKAEDRPSASRAVALFSAPAVAGLLPPASSRLLPPESNK